MIDKEITQHEKKKKASTTGSVCLSTTHLAMLEKDFRVHQMRAQLIHELGYFMFTFELVSPVLLLW